MWNEKDLEDWFNGFKLEYEFSHKFKTLSGWHYVYISKNTTKKVGIEFFDDVDNLKFIYYLVNDKNKIISEIKCSDNSTDKNIEIFYKAIEYLETLAQ